MTHRALLIFLVFLVASFSCLAQKSTSDQNELRNEHVDNLSLLEVGTPSRTGNAPKNQSEFKVVSYNIRWRGGEDLLKLIELFQTDPEIGGATVLGLQEVDRNKKRTKQANTVKQMAEALGMHYAWAAPPAAKATGEEETGVAILSIYPLRDVQRIVLPHRGPGKRRRVALGATINIHSTSLRFYSVHSENRMSVTKKMDQMKAAVDDLARFPRATPAIILGDLNTWEPGSREKTKRMFKNENFHTPFNDDATFCRRILLVDIKFKLDWVWIRELEVKAFGIDRTIAYSDHWPLWVTLTFSKPVERSGAPN